MQVLSTSFIKLETYVHRKSIRVTKIQNSADVSICSSVCLYTHTHTPQLIYPFICRQTLRSFPYLAVVNNDAMNEGMQTSLQDSDSMSLHMYPKELLDNMVRFSSVQFNHSVMSDSATSWTAACQASLSITNSQSLLKVMSIKLVMPSNHLILSCPLLLLPSIFPSIRVFSKGSVLHIRWPEYWSFSFSISPSNEYSGLISFMMDWLDLLPVQGTPKSLLQHHSSKASILQCSVFFIVKLPHPYMTTGKTIALTRQTFVGKVMSLLFNMLSRLVITFLPRRKRLLISCLQSPSAVILEPKE